MKTADGPLSGRPVSDLDLKDGKIVAKDGASQDMKDFFKKTGVGAFEEYAEFVPDGAPPSAVQSLYAGRSTLVGGSKSKKLMYAFGAEFVEVKINARTREIRVPRMVGAFAGGRIMNTRTARSQIMGGMIWGMSSALFEETQVDERNARYVNRELQDYLVPVNADAIDVEVILVPEIDDEVNPAGVKGLGELGNVGTNAAIANAVFHATGRSDGGSSRQLVRRGEGQEADRFGWDARIRTWEWRNQNRPPRQCYQGSFRLCAICSWHGTSTPSRAVGTTTISRPQLCFIRSAAAREDAGVS